jgi:hypothetical protein
MATALAGVPRAGAVHQNASHHLGRDREELRAVPPIRAMLIDETNVRLVDERGRLECVAGSLATELRSGVTTQFGVDQSEGTLPGIEISGRPGVEQRGDVLAG